MNRLSFTLSIVALTLLACLSCTTDQMPEEMPRVSTRITGRSAETSLVLAEGSRALFNAHGGLDIRQQILTFHNNEWSDIPFEWKETDEPTLLTVLYPTVPQNDYSTASLYQSGKLEDILMAQVQLKQKEDISLTFHHLFAQLHIEADAAVQQRLEQIQVTVPVQVEKIETETGNLTLTNTAHTTILPKNESGNYTFILPPSKDCALKFDIVTEQGTTHHVLAPHTFESHYSYSCRLTQKAEEPGIYTVEDLIAFSKLINGEKAEGKSLADFGKEQGGRTVYELRNDLILTDEDNLQLLPICYQADHYFNNLFDGNNHTITNYQVPSEHPVTHSTYNYSAFISQVGPQGIIRDLHFKQASTHTRPAPLHVGIVTGINKGLVDHCSVTSSSAVFDRDNWTGVIASLCQGNIINSWVDHFEMTLTSQNDKTTNKPSSISGGITGYLDGGKVLNCYTIDYQVKTPNGYIGKSGGIVGSCPGQSPSDIINCYNRSSFSLPDWMGSGIGSVAKNCKTEYFYTNNTRISAAHTDDFHPKHCFQMDGSYRIKKGTVSVCNILNSWIDENASIYPEIKFRRWESLTDGRPVLK